MKNNEIEYNLSTDYERLYRLLKEGCKVVGFIESDSNPDHSRLIDMDYNEKNNYFEIDVVVFESDFKKEEILDYMKRGNIRYFDIPDAEKQLPDGHKAYTCTECQHVNVKKDSGQVTVGYCDNCTHPIWNDDN